MQYGPGNNNVRVKKMRKKVVLLGSTGSVGQNACRVLAFHKDKFEVKSLSANVNYKMLFHQALQLGVSDIVIVHEKMAGQAANEAPSNMNVRSGVQGMIDCACAGDVDIVVCAILGSGALDVVLKALECGKTVALASKEVMLQAGQLVMETARRYGGKIIPVDSEHSAIFQCLQTHDNNAVKSLVLTCSGGPFRTFSAERLQKVTVEDALKHPVWSMGRKITVDSASLMNKALEVVEAAYMFNVVSEDIQVVVHPEGIVHSLVEFKDNSMTGLFSLPTMELPIQYALSYPEVFDSEVRRLDLAKIGALHFEQVNENFPSIDFARYALKVGKNMPLTMNAANDVAVEKFCKGEISFTGIWNIIEKTMSKCAVCELDCIETVRQADIEARKAAENI